VHVYGKLCDLGSFSTLRLGAGLGASALFSERFSHVAGLKERWGALVISAPAIPWTDVPSDFLIAAARPCFREQGSRTLTIVPRGAIFEPETDGEQEIVLFSRNILARVMKGVGNSGSMRLSNAEPATPTLSHDLDLLVTRARSGNPSATEIEYRALVILAQMFAPGEGADAREQRIVDQVTAHIDRNLDAKLDNRELCQRVGTSREELNRIFRKRFDATVSTYVHEQRLRVAWRLVEGSQMTLANVAFQVGFSSQAHLTLAFKAKYGDTPGTVRRQALRKETRA